MILLVTACGLGASATISDAVVIDPLALEVTVDACEVDVAITVVETPEEVILRARVSDRPLPWEGRHACAESRLVTLGDPLGGRPVIDATTGDPVRVHP